jgi:hypothetical protein
MLFLFLSIALALKKVILMLIHIKSKARVAEKRSHNVRSFKALKKVINFNLTNTSELQPSKR